MLEVINKRSDPRFTETDGKLLEVVANQAAVAIENARLVESMVQSEQLSVIGRMASSIIHDLKKPMSIIRGFAERRQTFPDLILEDVDRFLSMTQELLDYSRGNISLQTQEVEVGRWLDRIIEYLREDLDASNVVLITRFDHRGLVHIDADRLRRVVTNIAGNAADAMPKGGRLTISSRVVGDSWELAVTDTGTGIHEQLRPRIFEPFVSSGKEHVTGLGLAIAQEIVRGYGGDIQVETRT